MIAFLGALMNFVLLVVGEVFAERKRAREANEKYELDRSKFFEIADRAITKLRADAREENKKVSPVEDEVDRELHKK